MKPICLTLAAGLTAFALTADAQNTQSPSSGTAQPPAKISAAEAEKYLDQSTTVTGKVAQVSIREKLVYLNLEKRFPDSPFTCVIFARATNQFGDLKKLQGQDVEITGKIEAYKNKPQIVLNSTNQLKVIKKPAQD